MADPDDAEQQHLSDRDQTTSDADQTGADLDQTLSERDQASSDRDQRAADRDQRLADSDRKGGAGDRVEQANVAQRGRSQSAEDRAQSTDARQEATDMRHANATRRDRAAADRDAAAAARDRLSASIDAELELLARQRDEDTWAGDLLPLDLAGRLAVHLKRAAETRDRAAAHRAAAAADREEAARDRELSARDREQAARELKRESTDHLTGTMGRRAGHVALQREVDRTARSGEPLVLAFVDVEGLKAINDTHGHPAGDEALRRVARCLMATLRSYDVVMRFGGDEFVCSLAGLDLAGARERFAEIRAELATPPGHAIGVGLAQREDHETLEALIARADAALLDARRAALEADGDRPGAGGG